MRTYTAPIWRSPPATSRSWWYTTLWIPTGYAVTQFAGDATPVLAVVVLTASLAGLHRVLPGLVEVGAGSGGLLLGMFAAADDRGCGVILDEAGTGVVILYGSVMVVSAFVRLLGSGNGREMAKHLLVATAALQLSLFAVSPPIGRTMAAAPDEFRSPVLLAAVLAVVTVVGVRSRIGFPLLGMGLVTTLGVLAVAGGDCASGAVAALVGCATFALVARLLTVRPGALMPVES